MSRSIKALAPKPSDAIKAMIQGLRTLPSETFKIQMSTFGKRNAETKVCYGCAATCAIHQLAGKPPDFEHIFIDDHAEYLGFEEEELGLFENAIDDFRSGRPRELLVGFYQVSLHKLLWKKFEELTDPQDWHLSTNNWEDEISKVEEYVEKLITIGI